VQFEEKIWQTRIHVGAIFLSKALFFGGAKLGRRIMMVWWVGGEIFPPNTNKYGIFCFFFAWHLILHLVQQQTQTLEGHGFQDRIF